MLNYIKYDLNKKFLYQFTYHILLLLLFATSILCIMPDPKSIPMFFFHELAESSSACSGPLSYFLSMYIGHCLPALVPGTFLISICFILCNIDKYIITFVHITCTCLLAYIYNIISIKPDWHKYRHHNCL